VNHDDIAETLSNAVSDISIDASLCVQLVDVICTQPMREHLSKVYAQVFRFYRDAIEWYVSSKTSKFFGSFNERIKGRFEEAQKGINKTIKRMFYGCTLGTAAMMKVVHRDTAISKAEIFRQRQNHTATNTDPGEFMQEFLKAMYRFQAIENANSKSLPTNFDERPMIEDVTSHGGVIGRSEARASAKRLEEFIVGDEGHSLFGTGQLWIPDSEVSPRLQGWMAKDGTSHTLWISSPTTSNVVTSARAAAMNAVLAAWQVKAPVVSHFCERPRWSKEDQTNEESGMIGLVYCLIIQFLQFNVEGDRFDVSQDDFDRLDGTKQSFAKSLGILYRLLICTPHVSFCVIHDLNTLEWGGGVEWCHDFLDVLFQHQRDVRGPFNILLTTSGQSRVLAERVDAEDHCFTGKIARRVPLIGREEDEA